MAIDSRAGWRHWLNLRGLWQGFLTDLTRMVALLKRPEGQATLLLMTVIAALGAGLFFVVLGFDHLYNVAMLKDSWRPFHCRTPDNLQSFLIIIGGVFIALMAVFVLGEMMLYIDRMRRGRPGRADLVAVPAVLLLAAGAAGGVAMRYWC